MNRPQIEARIQQLGPWFHCIDLGSGVMTKTASAVGEPVDHPQPTWQMVKRCLPETLSGKSVLDVGCNAGFYAVELKRRGASRVLGVDAQRNLVRQAQFVRDVLGLDIEYRRMSVYDLDSRQLGQFDVTLALGLIYHCKHLVLALERLFAITRELLVLESAIYPPEKSPGSFTHSAGGHGSLLHPLAYVENPGESKEAIYNWFLPSYEALEALLRNVGFDEVEGFPASQQDRAIFACRKRAPYPDSRSISYLAAALTIEQAPEQCRAGSEISFRVQAENTGLARWMRGDDTGRQKGSVHLVAHLLQPDGEEPFSWYHAGAFLPHEIAPGEKVSIDIAMHAPLEPGRYRIEFDMVAEQLAWFEDLGSAVVKHTLTVE